MRPARICGGETMAEVDIAHLRQWIGNEER
jgi:hypothetical protein